MLFCEERKTEEEGSGEGTSRPPPVPFCKTFTVMFHRMYNVIQMYRHPLEFSITQEYGQCLHTTYISLQPCLVCAGLSEIISAGKAASVGNQEHQDIF